MMRAHSHTHTHTYVNGTISIISRRKSHRHFSERRLTHAYIKDPFLYIHIHIQTHTYAHSHKYVPRRVIESYSIYLFVPIHYYIVVEYTHRRLWFANAPPPPPPPRDNTYMYYMNVGRIDGRSAGDGLRDGDGRRTHTYKPPATDRQPGSGINANASQH